MPQMPVSHLLVFAMARRYSLAITSGEQGSRLTHSHARHYHFVLQSLTLWREVCAALAAVKPTP